MSGPVRSAICEQGPRKRLERLAEGASAQRPALLRFDCLLPDVDPWALVLDPGSDQARRDEPWLLWNDPRDGTRFATLGVLREFTGEAPPTHSTTSPGVATSRPIKSTDEAFRAAQAARQRLVASLYSLGEPAGFEQLPVLLGGFAFDAVRPPAGPWQGWPAARLWLPRVLVAYMHGRVTATVIAELADTDAATAHEQLCAQADTVDVCVERYGEVFTSSMPAPPGFELPAAEESAAGVAEADGAPDERWLGTVEAARQCVAQHDAADDPSAAAAKLVVARAEAHRSESPFDPFATAVALRSAQPGCVTYALHPGDGSAFVGATPETLLRLGGRLAESQALAGTSLRDEADAGDAALQTRRKDRHEQRLVVEAITAALQPFARTVEADAEPQLARFADVQHLSTSIHAWLETEQDAFALLPALHPTPAVNGHPRDVALGWLREHEQLERGYFAGPLGWINPLGDGTWVVALRCALLRDHEAWTYAGAGVVAESDPDAEWAETTWKMRAAAAALRAKPLTVQVPSSQRNNKPTDFHAGYEPVGHSTKQVGRSTKQVGPTGEARGLE